MSRSPNPARATLMWAGDGGERLSVEIANVADLREVAKRFAEAVQSDSRSSQAPVLTLSPEYAARREVGDLSNSSWTGTSPTDWTIEVSVHRHNRTTAVRLSSTSPDTTGGVSTRACGVDATLVPPRLVGDDWTDVMLVVPLGDRFLVVAGEPFIPGEGRERTASDITAETLVDLADTTKIADHPNFFWFGAR